MDLHLESRCKHLTKDLEICKAWKGTSEATLGTKDARAWTQGQYCDNVCFDNKGKKDHEYKCPQQPQIKCLHCNETFVDKKQVNRYHQSAPVKAEDQGGLS